MSNENLNIASDFLGNALSAGDQVVIKRPHWDYFVKGTVGKIISSGWVHVEYDNSSQGEPTALVFLASSNVIKVVK